MQKIESKLLVSKRLENTYPPLFILGAPRSGTTVIYLYLTNYYRFAYFPNIAKKYPYAVIPSTWWGRKFYRYKGTYENDYGIIPGLMAPGDGWDIFHRWFPRYDLSQPVNKDSLHELKTLISRMERIFNAPFINKNNNNTPRIHELKELFPHALFIYITRDFRDTVLSIMEARKQNNVPDDEWWSTTAPNFYDASFAS
ncbi:MAG: sulfotransferase, partial [bacterium]|nr:sulfotransferase [bacterium]